MAGNIAKLLRIVFDFTSSNAAALGDSASVSQTPAKSVFASLNQHKETYLDQAIKRLAEAKIDLTEPITKILGQSTNPWNSLTF